MTNTLTVAEFAAEAGISSRTVARLIASKTIKAQKSEMDGRRRVIPRAELERLFSARQKAEVRAESAGAAAGFLDASWRIGYRKSVYIMAETGVALAKHLADAGAEHEPDHCERCRDTIDQLLKAVEMGRHYAAVAPIAAEFYRDVLAAGRAADEAHAALRKDQPDA